MKRSFVLAASAAFLALSSSQPASATIEYLGWLAGAPNEGNCIMAKVDDKKLTLFHFSLASSWQLQLGRTDWNLAEATYDDLYFQNGRVASRALGYQTGRAGGKEIIISLSDSTLYWLRSQAGSETSLMSGGRFISDFDLNPPSKVWTEFTECVRALNGVNPADPFQR
ncbi:hypothetical protein GRI42_00025 [Erythrobacter gaetbuli]|uniref:Uncharacterized protein n=1 Tax=Qipengyuania gaetbuli TaxID=266952 RepID=A0A844XV45_9SPHN|nr:hypothetical protein [Qipengyuania gaetbuli]MXO49690.1 hypothetical protein [Qipengyuania gaetbuli]